MPAMSCAFWNGAAPCAAFTPCLSLNDGVRKKRDYRPSCDEQDGIKERSCLGDLGRNGRDGFFLEQTLKTSGDLSKDHSASSVTTYSVMVDLLTLLSLFFVWFITYDSPLFQPLSAKCPAWRTAVGAAPVHQRSSPSIHQGPTGWHPKLKR